MVRKSTEEASGGKISGASCFGKPGGGKEELAPLFFAAYAAEERTVPSPVKGSVIGEDGERTLTPLIQRI